MRSADAARRALAIAVVVALLTAASARAAEPRYGKVETFEPGKKYSCVPTADHKGWDCREADKGNAPARAENPAAPAPSAVPSRRA